LEKELSDSQRRTAALATELADAYGASGDSSALMAKLRKEIADLKSEISDFETYKKN